MYDVSPVMNLEDVTKFTEEMFDCPNHMIRLCNGDERYALVQNVSPHRSDAYDDTVTVLLTSVPYGQPYRQLSGSVTIDSLKEYLTSLSL